MVILDTDILVKFLRNDDTAQKKIATLLNRNQLLATTSINVAELFFGAYISEKREENITKIMQAIRSILSKGRGESAIYIPSANAVVVTARYICGLYFSANR